jgi:uncharacterized cupredoxin-like copper-binding protein
VNAAAKVAAVGLVLASVLFAGQAMHTSANAIGDAQGAGNDDVLGPGDVTVALTIHHSHFTPERVKVRPNTTVRFVVDNQDPINHELIVGDALVQARHEAGTEPVHPPRPGEVSIPALSTAATSFTFAGVVPVVYACHLPGHFAYGMHGLVEIVT